VLTGTPHSSGFASLELEHFPNPSILILFTDSSVAVATELTWHKATDMKRSRSKGNPWADHYTRKAKKERFPARSVYKLKELQQKFRLLKKGDRVLDLGCAPGSWTQYAAGVVGPGGRIVGVDLQPVTIDLPDHAVTVVGDAFDLPESVLEIAADGFDAVISDMAPSTTGIKNVDAARSEALCESALATANQYLATGGVFVCKIFQGADFNAVIQAVRACFNKQKTFKPQSTRKASKEIFIVGLGKK
jgi:23S rRNA (uridine2552-2'-O)-methyltransferase